MNKFCYYQLKIDITDALNPRWRFPVPTGNYGIWTPPAPFIFSSKWLEYTSDLGLNFHHALLFYRGSNMTSKEAHVDTHPAGQGYVKSALNWVIGGDESEMHWYDMPSPEAATVVKDPKTKVPYTTFQFKDLTLIESTKIKNEVTLVRTDLPHSITMGTSPRWCISARVDIPDDIPWEEIVEQMRSKNLLVERE